MTHLLLKYMEERMKETGHLPSTKRHGPVVTISRETGCSANQIADLLQQKITKELHPIKQLDWRVINKEVVSEAAKELEMPTEKINYVFKAEERKVMEEVLEALSSRYYKSDTTIRKTIMRVIRSIMEDGYVILVGRGGVAFAPYAHTSLNVLLQAPVSWRIDRIMEKHNLTLQAAQKLLAETDRERRLLVDHFYGAKTDSSVYDVVINCSSFSKEEIASVLYHMMVIRKML